MQNLNPELLTREPFPELGPGSPNLAVKPLLKALTQENLFAKVADRSMAMSCISGLWLLHDFLDESHTISQEIDTPTGSFWHGIMHRREPDPSNAKYWFRRVGNHSVIEMLREKATEEGYEYRDAYTFVDFCEQVRGKGTEAEATAKRVQMLEWKLLFDYCRDSSE